MYIRDKFCRIDPCSPMGAVWTLLIALNIETGEEVWRYSVKDWSPRAEGLGIPTGADGSIFIFVNDYNNEKSQYPDQKKSGVLCLDAYTGAVKWKCENMIPLLFDTHGFYPFWMTYYEKRLYIDMEDRVLCVDTETQEPVWDYVWNNEVYPLWKSVSVGSGVVVVHRRLQVECLDAETGNVLWTKPLKGKGIPVITKNEVFACGEETLYRMDIKTGKITGSYTVGEPIYSVVVARNRVLVGTEKDRIYCLGEPGHLEIILSIGVVVGVFIGVVVLILRVELLKNS
ncbi:MAG: PQQ-binding-like beta-propeller repeat protein [Theionarchaea archaeon]|nr:PQQ-binding-like beta-propeller repeat protein [Theionarchaea archaeon]